LFSRSICCWVHGWFLASLKLNDSCSCEEILVLINVRKIYPFVFTHIKYWLLNACVQLYILIMRIGHLVVIPNHEHLFAAPSACYRSFLAQLCTWIYQVVLQVAHLEIEIFDRLGSTRSNI
jgi:hypothetical protein